MGDEGLSSRCFAVGDERCPQDMIARAEVVGPARSAVGIDRRGDGKECRQPPLQ